MLIRYAGSCTEEKREELVERALHVRRERSVWFAQMVICGNPEVEKLVRDVVGDEDELVDCVGTLVFVRSESEEFDWDMYLIKLTESYIKQWVKEVVRVGLAAEVNVESKVLEEVARWFVIDLFVSGGVKEWLGGDESLLS